MKKTLIMAIILFIHLQLLAQEKQINQSKNFKNKKAVLFSLDGFNLGTINGGVGFKIWTSNNAFFFSSLHTSYTKEEREKNSEGNGSENSRQSFGVSLGLMKQLKFKNKLLPYFGTIVGAGYEQTENKVIPNEDLYDYFYRLQYKNESKRTLVSVSLHLIFGVEYFIKDNISLEGQYKLGGNYGWGKEKTLSTVIEAEQDISKLNVGIWSSSIILSIYL
jgi:hypothetical protein